MEFRIRPIIESDIPFILKGYQHVVRNDPMDTDSQLTAERIRSDILSHTPKAFIDVAVYNEEVIGFVIYSFVYFATYGQNIWVTTMYVDPFAPRSGLRSVSQRFADHLSHLDGKNFGIFGSIEKSNHPMQTLLKRYGGKVFDQFFVVGTVD